MTRAFTDLRQSTTLSQLVQTAALLLLLLPSAALAAKAATANWVTAWSASPTELAPAGSHFTNRTLAQRVFVSAEGEMLRLRFSNVDQNSVFVIPDVFVNGIRLTFDGSNTGTIPPAGHLYSDPAEMAVSAGEKVEILMFLPQQLTLPTIHWYGRETAEISSPGNFTGSKDFPVNSRSDFRIAISALDVMAAADTIGIVAIGDSITDGSTADVGMDRRWPDVAWRTLVTAGHNVAMANAGIGGDRLLRDAGHTGTSPGVIARLSSDVFDLANTKVVIVAAGINDIAWPGASLRGRELAPLSETPGLGEMIAGYTQVARRAQQRNLTVIGATITPFASNDKVLRNFHNEEKERLRRATNDWIRTSQVFDAIIDFDALLRDERNVAQLQNQYDSGDGIHPNEAGFVAMGQLAADTIAIHLSAVAKGKP